MLLKNFNISPSCFAFDVNSCELVMYRGFERCGLTKF